MAAADAKVNVFLKSESLLEKKTSSNSTKGSAKSDTSSTYPSTEYIPPARTPKAQTNQVKQSTPTVKAHQSFEKILIERTHLLWTVPLLQMVRKNKMK